MPEVPYSNRELKEFFGDIKETLGKIETQVTKTNGRVSNLENWRWFITGGLVIISMLVIPLLIYVFQQVN